MAGFSMAATLSPFRRQRLELDQRRPCLRPLWLADCDAPCPSTLIAIACLGACGRPAAPPPSAAAALPADRFVVRESLVADVKPVDAVVATEHTTEARARIGGTLVRLLVTENDLVRKGQLIAVVTDARIGFETRAFDAQAAAAAAEVDRTAAQPRPRATLYQKGIYAKAALDDAEAAAEGRPGNRWRPPWPRVRPAPSWRARAPSSPRRTAG